MIKTSYQKPELRDANDNVVQEGAFGKNTALSNAENTGWIDYVMNDLEALHDTIGDSAPTLDGNGHVVEPANLAIGDEDGVRLKTGYVKTSGGTVSGTLNIAQNLKMQDDQENVFGGIFVPGSTSTQQYVQFYGGPSAANTDVGSSLLLFQSGDGHFTLRARSADNSTVYDLNGNNNGTLTWRGQELAVRDSPAFTGTPTAPTQGTNDTSTKLATTEYVKNNLKDHTFKISTSAIALPNGADLNDYSEPGTYLCYSATVAASLLNCPFTASNFKLVVNHSTGNSYLQQYIFSGTDQTIYVRGKSGTNWTAWKKVAYSQDVLALTGGTMRGNLTLSSSWGGAQYLIKFDSIEKGIAPSSDRTTHLLQQLDAENRFIGGLLFSVGASGNVKVGLTAFWGSNQRRVWLEDNGSTGVRFLPSVDNYIDLGIGSLRWKQLYAGTTTISTSDERMKDNITAIPDAVLDAWGEVNWYQYQFKDSIAEKGETKARLHTGAIAQRIESVFTAHGIDANKYGLLCYDEWKYEPAERDEQGNIVQPARPAGNRYSLRYEEALCMEAAYQRRRADRLEQKLEAIEQRLSALETL